MGSLSLGLTLAPAAAAAAGTTAEPATLPQIPFGKHRLSRLICGANPFNAGSHLSNFVNQEMRSFFTPEQILKTLRRCEEVGINCWQMSGGRNLEWYRQLVDSGSRMQLISLGRDPAELPALAKGGCIGVAHHGEVTDSLFKTGKLEEVHEFLKRVKDAGMLAGVSTHMPAVVDAIESKGWEPDYYMTCVYERNRSAEELEEAVGPRARPGPGSLLAGGSAADVSGHAGGTAALPGLQDPGGRPAERFQGRRGTRVPRDVPGNQAAGRRDRRDLRPLQRPAGRGRRPRPPLRL